MNTTDPAPLLLIQTDGDALRFNAYGLTTAQIIDALRRTLLYTAAQHAGLATIDATIPAQAAIAVPAQYSVLAAAPVIAASSSAPLNGRSKPAAAETEPAPAAAPGAAPRKKPGPQPGTKRRRKTDIDEIEAQAQRDTWT